VKKSRRHKHTQTQRGKRVFVRLQDGTIVLDRFVRRAENNRWIELEEHGRIQLEEIKSFGIVRGKFDPKRLQQPR